ncbi:hypothetical protein JCM5296_003190 [Sporobolomyces johnsonii]
MPLLSLPTELVRLVLDHLEVDLPTEKERRQAGIAVSLTCRRLKEAGMAIAWKELTVWVEDDEKLDALLRHLRSFASVASFVRTLELVDKGWNAPIGSPLAGGEPILQALQQLVSLCPGLETLDLKCRSAGDVARPLKILVLASNLRSLTLCHRNVCIDSTFGETLSRLVGLRQLSLYLTITSSTDSFLSNAAPVTPLALHTVVVGFLSGAGSPIGASLEAHKLFKALDLPALQTCTLVADAISTYTLDWLTKCPNLKTLGLGALPTGAATLLCSLITFLERFSSLQDLKIFECPSDPSARPSGSPASTTRSSLDQVLAVLPPTLIRADFEGFCFEGLPPLKSICSKSTPPGRVATCLVCFVKGGSQSNQSKVRHKMLIKLVNDEEKSEWRIR